MKFTIIDCQDLVFISKKYFLILSLTSSWLAPLTKGAPPASWGKTRDNQKNGKEAFQNSKNGHIALNWSKILIAIRIYAKNCIVMGFLDPL